HIGAVVHNSRLSAAEQASLSGMCSREDEPLHIAGNLCQLCSLGLLCSSLRRCPGARSALGLSVNSQILLAAALTARSSCCCCHGWPADAAAVAASAVELLTVMLVWMVALQVISQQRAIAAASGPLLLKQFASALLAVPSAGLAALACREFTPAELLRSFGVYLESVALLPQLFLYSAQTDDSEAAASSSRLLSVLRPRYLLALLAYRACHGAHSLMELRRLSGGSPHSAPIGIALPDSLEAAAGCLQTLLLLDFCRVYYRADRRVRAAAAASHRSCA
ncbi:hypothetical protein BOX15_Mlig004117g2, partial [Macrostomum lignano]